MGLIYLITELNNETSDHSNVKIGVTTNASLKRVKELQTGNSSELMLINSFKTDTPFKLEKLLHLYYHNHRLNGEWFNLSNEQIKNFTEICQKYQNNLNLILNP